jgi:glycosyltransferase involved in cell wall biosynthesis
MRNSILRVMVRRFATDVLAGTQAVMAAVWGIDWAHDRRFAIVDQGVAVRDFISAVGESRDSDDVANRIIQVGRIDSEKNQLLTLEAFAIVRASRPQMRLCLVGRGLEPYAGAVRARAHAGDLAGTVEILGERTDVPRLLASAAVLIHPTLREGWPGVVVEARASGMPVVASDVTPIVEVAERLEGVHLLHATDPPESWARTVLAVLPASNDTRRRLEEGQQLVDSSFDSRVAATSMLRYWSSM